MAFARSRPVSILLWLLVVASLLLVLVPVSSPTLRAETAPSASQPQARVLHVFLAVGQSNMSGRGRPSGGADDPADPRIFEYGAKSRVFRAASVPLDMHDVATGISPATTFARAYLKSQPANVSVLIIPAAHGATSFTAQPGRLTWTVGAAADPTDDLPALAVTQTREGMAAAKAAGYSADLKGILWHQGEGNSATTAKAYADALDRLIAYFRSRFHAPTLPFVLGGLAPEGMATRPGLAGVDKAHRETPSRVDYTGFAKSRAGGVSPGDTIHFSRAGIEFLGKSYLAAYRQAVANGVGSSNNAPVPTSTDAE